MDRTIYHQSDAGAFSSRAVARIRRVSKALYKELRSNVRKTQRLMAQEPFKVLLGLGLMLMSFGAAPVLQTIFLYFSGAVEPARDALLVGGVVFLMGALAVCLSLASELVSHNRQLVHATTQAAGGGSAVHESFPEDAIRAELNAFGKAGD